MKIKDILKGIRNKRNRLRVGYVYAPYVTVQSISVITNLNFPKKSLSLKYSTNDINSNYFSKITIEK
jgi:hypothetical protein